MTGRRFVLCAVALVTCAAGLWAAGQEPASPPIFRSGIDLIQLDVSVLDEARRPLRGLSADDFTVFVDGQPRRIVTFRPVDVAPPPLPASAAWIRDTAPDVATNARIDGRVVAIVIDDGSFGAPRVADLFAVRKARQLARAAVEQLGPEDLAAVLFTENSRTAQGFTTDRRRLLAAIDNAALTPSPDVNMRTDISDSAHDMGDPFGVNRPTCDCGVCSIEMVGRIADSLRPLGGQRKLLIFISAGVRVDAQVPVPYDPIGKSYIYRVEHCNAAKQKAMLDAFRRAALSNVTIQAVDVRGLLSGDRAPKLSDLGVVETTGGIDLRVEFLRAMAENTGGRAVVRNNDVEHEVAALIAETSAYYLLGVEAPPPNEDGRLHPIAVEVDRPNAEVRTRHGYYTPTPEERNQAAGPEDLASVIAGVLPRRDIPLEVSVVPCVDVDDPGRSSLVVVLRVTPSNPATGVAHREQFKVVAAAFETESGRPVPSHEQTVDLAWNATTDTLAQFEVVSRLSTPPGRYEVRAGVESGDGRTASVFTYVEVPNFAREPLSASGIVLSASPSPRRAGESAVASLIPVAPTSRRTFFAADRVTAFLRVYEAKTQAGAVTVTTRIEDTAADVAAELKETVEVRPVGVLSTADYQIDLPIADLALGTYLLTMEAERDGTTVRRTAIFTVR